MPGKCSSPRRVPKLLRFPHRVLTFLERTRRDLGTWREELNEGLFEWNASKRPFRPFNECYLYVPQKQAPCPLFLPDYPGLYFQSW